MVHASIEVSIVAGVALLCSAGSSATLAFILCWERAAWMSSFANFVLLGSAPRIARALHACVGFLS